MGEHHQPSFLLPREHLILLLGRGQHFVPLCFVPVMECVGPKGVSKQDIERIVETIAWAGFGSFRGQCPSVNRELLVSPLDKERDNNSAK